jgi:hypothetical protein
MTTPRKKPPGQTWRAWAYTAVSQARTRAGLSPLSIPELNALSLRELMKLIDEAEAVIARQPRLFGDTR